jgi:hypothetical protein
MVNDRGIHVQGGLMLGNTTTVFSRFFGVIYVPLGK